MRQPKPVSFKPVTSKPAPQSKVQAVEDNTTY